MSQVKKSTKEAYEYAITPHFLKKYLSKTIRERVAILSGRFVHSKPTATGLQNAYKAVAIKFKKIKWTKKFTFNQAKHNREYLECKHLLDAAIGSSHTVFW